MTDRFDPYRPSRQRPGLSRRQFLGTATALGVGGAAFLAGCGSDDGGSSSDTTSGGADTTAAGGAETTAGTSPGTSGSGGLTGGGGGDGTIKLGYVTPQTGPLAAFGESDAFVLGGLRELFADGLMIQGKSYKVDIIDRDSESNSNTAATAAQELIANEGVHVLLVAQTPDTTVPGRPAGHQQRDPGAVEQRAVAAALPRASVASSVRTSSRRSPPSGTTTSSGASRTSSRSSPRCGATSSPAPSSAGCGRTTPTATPGVIPTSASRRRWSSRASPSSTPAGSRSAAATTRRRSTPSRTRAWRSSPACSRRRTSATSGPRRSSRG